MKPQKLQALSQDQLRQVRRLRFEKEMERSFALQHAAENIGRVRIVFGFLAVFGILGLIGRSPSSDPAVATVDRVFTGVWIGLSILTFFDRFRPYAAPALATAAVLSQIAIGLTAKSALPAWGIVINLFYAIVIIATLQVRFWTAVTFGFAMLAARAWTFSYRSMWTDDGISLFVFMVIEVVFLSLGSYLSETRARIGFLLERSLQAERARTQELVQNVLPPSIANQLSREPGIIARHHDAATILFADIVGFTPFAANHTPNEVVGMLNDVFSRFDALIKGSPVVKIKTVGDAYMIAGGIPDADPNHIANVANAALELRGAANAAGVAMRIGIHTGPLIAGVLGTERLMYDVWGPTVNLASRLEASAESGQIVVSATVQEALKGTHDFESLGSPELKGLGPTVAYLLLRRKVAAMDLT